MSAPAGPIEKLWNAVDERYQLGGLVTFFRHKEVPAGAHSMVWYYLGGVSLFFFTVQIATGILLLMNYQVGEGTSYESMKLLVGHVPFGWLVRSIHCWSAHLMSIAVLIHLLSVLFFKAYRKPRELTWYSGFAMLGLVLGFGFSGYLLPWNELSFFATAVGTDSVKSVPVVGPWLLRVMRGGEEVSVQTLYRFFALHVCILPLVMGGLIGAHLLFIQRQGMAEPLEKEPGEPPSRRHGMPFFPNFAMRDLLLWVICLNVLALLAVTLPFGPGIPGMEWELGSKANPLKPAYPGIKPEWYFLWVYQMLREFPAHLAGMEGPQACLLLVTVLGAIAFAIPLLDRNAAKGKPSPFFTDLGAAAVLFIVLLTLKAWDIGVHVPKGQDPAADPALAATIARTAASWTLLLGVVTIVFRRVRFRHTAFVFTGAVLLQAALNGFAGISWLVAGAIALAVPAGFGLFRLSRKGSVGGAIALVLASSLVLTRVAAGAEGAGTASGAVAPEGHVAEATWPPAFGKLFLAVEKGQPIVLEKGRSRFRSLPSHAQKLFFAAVESGYLSSPAQLATLLDLDLDDRKVELLVADNCVLCHTNPDIAPDEILFRARPDRNAPLGHLDLREIVSDVHFRRGLMCAGCHGGKPTDAEMSPEISARWPEREARQKDRSWIPEFCARCHASSEFMRGYNPKLPVDQLLKYRTSKHGELLLVKKDSKAAQCVSCHGVHGIRAADSPASRIFPENVPATCGKCHADAAYMKGYTLEDGQTPLPTDQLDKYRKSVHGNALLKKHDVGAPACNDCHGNHAALPPKTASVAQVCRNCHTANGALFDGSPHKKAFEKNGWPECATCHGKHDIALPTDEMMANDPKGLCHACHAKYGQPKCDETARFYYDSITRLRDDHIALAPGIDHLAERGFEVDELRFQAGSVAEALRKTRLGIHTFDRSDFQRNAGETTQALASLRKSMDSAWNEYRFRRNGLILATAFISVFGLLLYLKIRQLDRKGGGEG